MPPPEELNLDPIATPIGEALLVTDREGRLAAFDWPDGDEPRLFAILSRRYKGARHARGAAPRAVRRNVDDYFAGDLDALRRIPWRASGTPFQMRAWNALCEIPAGETRTYAQQAEVIGAPTAVRAVGLANGANPVGLIVPCHRVIGADGSLTGYGGGLHRKRWLLRHEGVVLQEMAA